MSIRTLLCVVICLLPMVSGCAGGSAGAGAGTIVVVTGVNGDGPWYSDLRRGLTDGRVHRRIETFGWGLPGPLFAMNFNSKPIHHAAERRLAARIKVLAGQQTSGPIAIVAHSAGAGVAMGALARLPEGLTVDQVILLHPSLSPQFDLSPGLTKIDQRLIVFHSERDTTFLQWRTGTFGTYDGVRTTAAGNRGFDLSSLAPELRQKVVQRAYEPQFAELGNDGGHFGVTSRRFVAEVIAP
ncbi:MAG: hypothetical protein NZ561_13340, partial [Phycisphaerae bacterium]|nr:hypothetical protein [Phycisphaerae bacterium]